MAAQEVVLSNNFSNYPREHLFKGESGSISKVCFYLKLKIGFLCGLSLKSVTSQCEKPICRAGWLIC